jgi:hypothetical protein
MAAQLLTFRDVGQVVTLVNGEGQLEAFIAGAAMSPTFALPIARFVDPQNVSGFASNSNLGANSTNVPPGSGPILTTAENNGRMQGKTLTGNTIITYLSEDLANVGVSMTTLDLAGFTLTFDLPLIAVSTGHTIFSVTAIDPTVAAGGQRQRIQIDSAAFDYTPFVLNAHGLPGTATAPMRVVDQTRDVSSWIMSQETGEVTFAHLTRPVDNAVANSPQFVATDAVTLVRPGRLPLMVEPVVIATSGGSLVFNNCQIHAEGLAQSAPTAFALNLTTQGAGNTTFNHCSFDGPLLFGGLFNDCYFSDGAQGTFLATVIAGGWLPNSNTDQLWGVLNIGGDLYVTGDSSFNLGATFYSACFFFAGALNVAGASGLQVQSVSNSLPGLQLFQGGAALSLGLLWGNGNTGLGLQIAGGVTWASSHIFTPNITGATGDFGFLHANTILTTARAWDDSVGAYTTLRACTWANYVATIAGGGFSGNAHCVQANSAVVQE